jgi:hypothetical protein
VPYSNYIQAFTQLNANQGPGGPVFNQAQNIKNPDAVTSLASITGIIDILFMSPMITKCEVFLQQMAIQLKMIYILTGISKA